MAVQDHFYDQSHMIREMRMFAGRTPARIADPDTPYLSSFLSLRANDAMQASVERASHSQSVLNQIHQFWGLLGDSESHALHYTLTGHEEFLSAYRTNVDEMGRAVDVLRGLNPARHIVPDRPLSYL